MPWHDPHVAINDIIGLGTSSSRGFIQARGCDFGITSLEIATEIFEEAVGREPLQP